MDGFSPIAKPNGSGAVVSAAQVLNGPLILPISRIRLYSPSEWEEFINEWAACSLNGEVVRFSGSGDRGVDVAVFLDSGKFNGMWHGYQCKHYASALSPSDAKPEIGKILWYSFKGEYRAPQSYTFMAPCGIGTKLNNLLNNSKSLKKDLITTWDSACRKKITETAEIPLDGAFLAYVSAFDFSIFLGKQPLSLVDEHRCSPYHLQRFGGGLPPRPLASKPPPSIAQIETRYVEQLLEAYSEREGTLISVPADLKTGTMLHGHFARQREAFYQAETLRVFVRDKVEPGTFERLQEELYLGVVDTSDQDYSDGYERVVAVTRAAQEMQLVANPIAPIALTQDRHGICHQLANEDRLKWKK